MALSRHTRNKYMKAICAHFKDPNKKYMDVNALHIYHVKEVGETLESNIKSLESMGYIHYIQETGQNKPFIQITDSGRCYFEAKHDKIINYWSEHIMELIALIFSAIAILISAVALYVSILGLPEQLQALLGL